MCIYGPTEQCVGMYVCMCVLACANLSMLLVLPNEVNMTPSVNEGNNRKNCESHKYGNS